MKGSSLTTPLRVGTEGERQLKVDGMYISGDVEKLRRHHDEVKDPCDVTHEEEPEGIGGDYIKAFVFGGLDGIVTTFALVAGLGGAQVEIATLIAVGLAKVLSDAFSMGFGEYTSATAEMQSTMRLRRREEWETENYEDGELKEMIEIYMERGVTKEDARNILETMVKYKKLFVDHMMVMEHNVLPVDEEEDANQPLKQGFVCFLAFAIFGLVPLIATIVLYLVHPDNAAEHSMSKLVAISYGFTAVTLFVMGITKAKLSRSPNAMASGCMMVLNGTIAGGIAFGIGGAVRAALAAH